ncbi:MAG: thioredoxin family protein [Kiritimatiellia bacterium]
MRKMLTMGVAVAGVLLAGWQNVASAAVETGSEAPDFTLSDVHGNSHTLREHRGRIVVLEWTNYDCPFVKKFYEPGAMQALQAEMKAKGVVWLSICSSAAGKQGNFTKSVWLQRMEAAKVQVPVLLDESGDVGRAYSARTTPHMFVIDAEGKVVYQGAIDSIRSTNSDDIERAENYVQAAVTAVLAGQAVETTDTRAYGCSVKYE